jgi:uncharacterized membrane protein YdbT with pleckstrin-like domain
MPLTTCPDCGREISTSAPACPHCGRPTGPVVAPPMHLVSPPSAEESLWHGTPSWLLLLGKIIWLAIVAIALPLLVHFLGGSLLQDPAALKIAWFIVAAVILWRGVGVLIAYARIRSTMYTVTTQRVTIESGIAEKKVEDIDLRYIDDTQFRQRLIERMLGIGSVTIVSSDKTTPMYTLRGIPDPRGLRELIRAKAYEASQRQLFTRST